jgi:hypothetical protein
MAKKMKRSCGDVSPRKKMAMEGTMGRDVPRKFQDGGMVSEISPEQAMRLGRQMASAMAKPRADVTGMDEGGVDRAMGMRRSRMSSGGMRPQMRRNRMV